MQFNVVYTLFFATAITCGLRGLGWWVAHFVSKSKQQSKDPLPYGRPQPTGAGSVAG
jgi:hypothetical protein